MYGDGSQYHKDGAIDFSKLAEAINTAISLDTKVFDMAEEQYGEYLLNKVNEVIDYAIVYAGEDLTSGEKAVVQRKMLDLIFGKDGELSEYEAMNSARIASGNIARIVSEVVAGTESQVAKAIDNRKNRISPELPVKKTAAEIEAFLNGLDEGVANKYKEALFWKELQEKITDGSYGKEDLDEALKYDSSFSQYFDNVENMATQAGEKAGIAYGKAINEEILYQ